MNALPTAAPFPVQPCVAELVDFATAAMNTLFDGSAYSRLSTLPKLLCVPELWLIPGENTVITETILADLEALLAAQANHLRRGRVDLFDVSRFWALTEACRGEKRNLIEQLKVMADKATKRHAHSSFSYGALRSANDEDTTD